MSPQDLHHLVQTALQTATGGSGSILQIGQFILAGLFAAGGIVNLIGPQWLLGLFAPLGLGGHSPKTYGALALAAAVGLAKPDLQFWCIAFAVAVVTVRIFTSILRRLRIFEFAFLAFVLAIPPFFVSQYWTLPVHAAAASGMCLQSKDRASASASARWSFPGLPRSPAG